jgi:hypothetical protein
MSAFLRTLFGDARTVLLVMIVMAAEWLLTANGFATSAAFTIPPLVLAGVGWLATR